MAIGLRTLVERLMHRRRLRIWEHAIRQARGLPPARLRVLRERVRQIRRKADRVLFIADERLALPGKPNAIARPLYCDWAHRPQLWRGAIRPGTWVAVDSRTMFGEETTLFHDCKISELTARQIRNRRDSDNAAFALRIEVFRFDGTFLSLAIDLPPEAAQGLLRSHLIRLTARIDVERKIEIFARLNVRHGPNTEQIVRELPMDGGEVMVEFDLAYTRMNEKRVEHLWLDLIFEGPEMNQIVLRDLTFSRRPRAEF